MANDKRQFDPVAAAAISGLDASQRSIRQVRSQVDAPELPAESQAFTGARNAIQSVSQFAPANVLARQQTPVPQPGQAMQKLPDLPGMQGQGLPQALQQFAPQNVLSNIPSPQDFMPGNNQRRRDRGGNGGSSGGNSGNGGSSGGSSNKGSAALAGRRSR